VGHGALEIQVEDADVHRLLAAALVELDELDRAIEEFETPSNSIRAIFSSDSPWPMPCSSPSAGQGQKVLEELLRRDPKFPGRHPAGKPQEETLEWRGGSEI